MALLSDLPNSQGVTPDSWSRIVRTADLPAPQETFRAALACVEFIIGMRGTFFMAKSRTKLVNCNLHAGQSLVLWGVSSAHLGKNLATYTEL